MYGSVPSGASAISRSRAASASSYRPTASYAPRACRGRRHVRLEPLGALVGHDGVRVPLEMPSSDVPELQRHFGVAGRDPLGREHGAVRALAVAVPASTLAWRGAASTLAESRASARLALARARSIIPRVPL